MPITLTIEWHHDDLPDDDTTVFVITDDGIEQGFRDADCWRNVLAEQIEVKAWAHIPEVPECYANIQEYLR